MSEKLFKVSIRHDRSIDDMISSALGDLGGIHQVIPSGKRILIKPNLVIAKKNETGATTNPRVIETIIKEILKTEPADIALGESSQVGGDTMEGYKITGMDKIAKKYSVKVIDFKREKHINKEVPQGKEIKNVKIASPVFEYDYLINVPVLKIHCQTTVTIGMKNLKGCIHDQEKHRFHRLNLHQCIVDLNTVIKPDLTIVDATTCSLQWELGGDPVKLDTIVVGENVLAVDMIAASLLGYNIDDVRHLKIAGKSGIGPKNIKEIEVFNIGEIESSEKVIEDEQKNLKSYKLTNLKVIKKGTCTSCEGALTAAIRRLSKEGHSPECAVVMGQLAAEEKERIQEQKNKGIPIVAVGQCGCKVAGNYSAANIKGCPARAEDIYTILKNL